MKMYTKEELKGHAQETAHLKNEIKIKISDLDNALSFSQRKSDFCRGRADESIAARENAYIKWETLENEARQAEKRLTYIKIKCAVLKFLFRFKRVN